jgi:hypothetical protein
VKGKIKRFALRALLRMDGTPMPEAALVDSIRLALPDALLTDINLACAEMESDHLVTCHRDDLTETLSWLLTTTGTHKAKQIT